MYLEEKVSQEEGLKFAQKIGGFFKLTSALNSTGINDIFTELGKYYLDPDYRDMKTKEKDDFKDRSNTLKLDSSNTPKKKKFFC